METAIKRLYEGLFLVDSAEAASDWDGVIGAIERVLGRAGAEVVSLKKWDERKLTFEIKKKTRGTYILVYFNCDPLKIGGIERDVQLSELILRVMILKTDQMSQEDIDRETPLAKAEREEAEAAEKATEEEAAAPAEEAPATEEASEAAEAEEAPAEEETKE